MPAKNKTKKLADKKKKDTTSKSAIGTGLFNSTAKKIEARRKMLKDI